MTKIVELNQKKRSSQKSEITICTKCTHLLSIAAGPRTGIWYNMFCKAQPLPKGVNPLNGKECYITQNDFGNIVHTDDRFHYCRDINDGNCPHFSEKDYLDR